MKKIYKYLLCFIFVILCVLSSNYITTKASYYTVSCGECVMEVESGRILYEHNGNNKLPMASTTKILTAITVIENCDVEKYIEVPNSCVGVEGSSIYLKEGEKLKIIDLLYGLMLRSGNDSAELLALSFDGNRNNFIKLMNETAKKIGAVNSNFTNPHGLNDDNHYTTANDLAMITSYAMKNSLFKKIVATSKIQVENSDGEKRLFINKNKMLHLYEGANGVKTGYTKVAGRCLVSSATVNDMNVVCVVLDSPQMFERSGELLDFAFDNYRMEKIVDKDFFHYCVPVKNSQDFVETYIKNDFYYPIKDDNEITFKIDLPEFVKNNVKKDSVIGEMKIYCEKQLIFSQKIYKL